jgi:hypothetical protein
LRSDETDQAGNEVEGGKGARAVPSMYRRGSVDERKVRRKEVVDPSEAVEGIDVV